MMEERTVGPAPSKRARWLGPWVVGCFLAICLQLWLHSTNAPPRPPAAENWAFLPPVVERQNGAPAATGVLTIGVVVTVTDCGGSFPLDGAVVLRHSIVRQPSKKYRYKFYAVYHPAAAGCAPPLADAGYILLERGTPVNVSEIKGDYLRNHIHEAVCCGEKELIKFESFLLTQHPAVILMDADLLVLKPLDDIIDLILYNDLRPKLANHHLENATQVATTDDDVWMLYVNDYYTAKPPYRVTPTQGGFVVLKPNRTIHADLMQIVLRGDYDRKLGWGNVTGKFWGGMAVQGLLTYYFQVIHPDHALALEFCIHDHVHFRQTTSIRLGDELVERCVAPNCRNCRDTPFEDTYSIHFTLAGKPWDCRDDSKMDSYRRRAFGTWFQYRGELEKSWGRSGRGGSSGTSEAMLGYCSVYGKTGYEAIRQPYGAPG